MVNFEDLMKLKQLELPGENRPTNPLGISQLSDWMLKGDESTKYPQPAVEDVLFGLQKSSLACRLGRLVITRDTDTIRMCSIPELSWSDYKPDAKVEVQTVRMCTVRSSLTMGADILLDDPQFAARRMVDSVMKNVARQIDSASFLGEGADGVPLGILKIHEEKMEWRGHEVTREALGSLISRLSPRYKQGAAFFVGPDVYAKLMTLKDANGITTLAVCDQEGTWEVYGFPVYVVPEMSKAIIFGSMKDGLSVYVSPRIEAHRRSDLMWTHDLLRVDSHVHLAIHIVPDAFAVYYLYENVVVRAVEEVKKQVKKRVRQVKDKLTAAVMALACFIRTLPDNIKAFPGRLKDFLCRHRDKDDEEYEDEGEEDI